MKNRIRQPIIASFAKLFIALILISAMGAIANADVPGVHGMLLFGENNVYLSHLPMYHAPHDYQAIMEISLDPSSLESYRRDQQLPANQNLYYTFVPEKFVLPDVVLNKKCFNGSIHRGHFERGGIELISSSKACISNVLVFSKLNSKSAQTSNWSGFIFGNATESWLAHKITARPNFDQILRVGLATSTIPSIGPGAEPISIDLPDTLPIEHAREIEIQRASGAKVLGHVQSLYSESGDLG